MREPPLRSRDRVAIRRIDRCRVAGRVSLQIARRRERLDVGPHATAPARSRHRPPSSRSPRCRARELRRQHGTEQQARTRCARRARPRTRSSTCSTPFFWIAVVIGVGVVGGDDLRRAALPGEARARSAARSRSTATPCSRSAGRSSRSLILAVMAVPTVADDLQPRQDADGPRRRARHGHRPAVVVAVPRTPTTATVLHRQRDAHPGRPPDR